MANGPDDDLEERIDELEAALNEVSEELKRRSPRGPFGLPRPPTPGEIIRFTDEAAIPAAIAILEANIRMLEALRHALRLIESGDRARQRSAAVETEASEFGERALARFDRAIADLERVVDGTPAHVPGNEVLSDARALREDLETRIATAETLVDDTLKEDSAQDAEKNGTTAVDIDAEIESIRRQQEEPGPDDDSDEET